MRGTSVMPISALVLFLSQHRENVQITGDDLEEYRYIVANSVPAWLDTILLPYREMFVRRDAYAWDSGSMPGTSKPDTTYCWAGHGDSHSHIGDKNMWNGVNVGFHPISDEDPDGGRLAISFKVAGVNLFGRRNFHQGEEFMSWVELVAIPELEKRLVPESFVRIL